MDGTIELIIGPMFSGKSSELLRRLRRHYFGNKKCIVIKYDEDTRYSENSVTTHDNQSIKAISCNKLNDLIENEFIFDNFDVIGIDEGQFFTDIIDFSDTMANKGKVIIIAALDSTFERTPFNNICSLIPKAEVVLKLNSICTNCGKNASFSRRLTNEKEIKVIGGKDKYTVNCRICYFGESKVFDDIKTDKVNIADLGYELHIYKINVYSNTFKIIFNQKCIDNHILKKINTTHKIIYQKIYNYKISDDGTKDSNYGTKQPYINRHELIIQVDDKITIIKYNGDLFFFVD